jgi:hypothetical protein
VIIYNPTDGDAMTSSIKSMPRHCFLMTRLGNPIPQQVVAIGKAIASSCLDSGFKVIDASTQITGRDFLLKIWKQIAAIPLAIGVCHEDIPQKTQANIYYELGIAQALGKETIIVKSPNAEMASDFVRTEYIEFNTDFGVNFSKYLRELDTQAEHYELMADQIESNPILSIDYLKRAFLITGNVQLRDQAQKILLESGLKNRAKNSVEQLVASF